MKVIAIDPSGNFTDGKGITGVAIAEVNEDTIDFDTLEFKDIRAVSFQNRHDYWKAIIDLITPDSVVVIEKFQIRNNGFTVGSAPETLMLIGVLIYTCENLGVKYVLQLPTVAKTRYKDNIIQLKVPKLIKTTNGRWYFKTKMLNDHKIDALRHLLYYTRYNIGKEAY